MLLVLRAFASGSAAMTGIEAISNAVPSFKLVEWRKARITLTWMVALLIGMFVGVLAISRPAGGVPMAGQTILSQRAHLSFGQRADVCPVPGRHDHALATAPRPAALAPQPGPRTMLWSPRLSTTFWPCTGSGRT